ncbi:MAG: LGFP repeat-containing protein [Corynebacterium sp.]|uniref:LGFP repeat-containing protein n=1 Tax=unclassified Corynebacterium TaxID=2624378 RepID=UPI0026482FAF|nr:hypothetical protein [Corynebacterium sp.]MDN5581529.1 hypothetical protein [Corynebacterium sp.]MDN5718692.1 hypothetical protein [Corynebacterium sp.]MDN6323783.1 hypothetical protein [Corynebacterium sp.]MDN6509872.1 hypothetical protein [Corynebacterium sp.]
MKSILKRTFTAVAAGGLLLGAAACSDDDSDSVSDASSAAESGAAEASDAMGGSESTEAESTESESAEGSEGSGDTELPEGLQAAYDEAGGEQGEWGAVQNVESADGATLATFDNGWAVENDSGEVTPLIGMIGETWANDGGLENEIGLPTAPESGDAMQGWTQQFENGTISWMQDEDGTWDADVEGNE